MFKNLNEIVSNIVQKWSLYNLKPLVNLTHHYLFSGFQNQKPIILKLGLNFDDLKREALAINAFSSLGMVKLLAETDGALLLEAICPGNSLKSFFPSKESESIFIASNLMKTLHTAKIPEQKIFMHMNESLNILNKKWNIPVLFLQHARKMRDELYKTSSSDVLLHGDLHHDNILQSGNDWIAIDPKGLIGEPAYETTAFIMNPIPELLHSENSESIISQRILEFANSLNISPKRILDCCFVRTIQSWIWNLEDNLDIIYFAKFAEILYQIDST